MGSTCTSCLINLYFNGIGRRKLYSFLFFSDASGVQLYYTPKLRKYAEDIIQTGDGAIYIPPNSKDFKVRGLCSHECSLKKFEKPFNITSILLHMHGHGELHLK